MSNKFILCRVNNESAVFHILSNAQETQVTDASLDNYLVIVLNWKSVKINAMGTKKKFSIIFSSLHLAELQSLTAKWKH